MIIDGQVDGDIHAIERLELGAQARVKGNLHYGLIETAMGAQIEGPPVPDDRGQSAPAGTACQRGNCGLVDHFLGQEDNGRNVVTHGLKPGDSET